MTIKDCPNCGGTHYGSIVCPYIEAPCVVCGDATILACSDCAINSGGKNSVHVCKKAECRTAHDRLHAESVAHLNVARTYTPLEMLERVSHLNSFRELNAILPEIRALLACSSEPISAGSMPNNSSGADRDAVIATLRRALSIAEPFLEEDMVRIGGGYGSHTRRDAIEIVRKALAALKSPPTVG